MNRYAVIGHPVAHSKSPLIHGLFARQFGITLEYGIIDSPPARFAATLEAFFAAGGKGLNVTVPFKEQAWQKVRHASEGAFRAGAVNTVWEKDGVLWGDNTDGTGLIRDLAVRGMEVEGRRVLVVGAGGAVRGVLQPLLVQCPAQVVIANRTPEKAVVLAAAFAGVATENLCVLAASDFSQLAGSFDLVINGTSAGLTGDVPLLPAGVITAATDVYDMLYGNGLTAFNAMALQQHAVRVCDGLGMLVGQAAEAFYLWHGVRPDSEAVLKTLRGKKD